MQHLLFSVIEPQFRGKPAGVSDVSLLAFTFVIFYYYSLPFHRVHGILLLLWLNDSLPL